MHNHVMLNTENNRMTVRSWCASISAVILQSIISSRDVVGMQKELLAPSLVPVAS